MMSKLDEILSTNMFLKPSSMSPANFQSLIIEDTKSDIKKLILELINDTAKERASSPKSTDGLHISLVQLSEKVKEL